jgi:hypothetical protein
VASAVGFVAINHNTVTDTRGKGVEEWSQLETQIANLTERRKQVSTARPEGTVQAEINQLLRAPGVGNCLVINGPATREICPQVDKLKVELENAKSAAWLDGRLDELRGEVRKSDRVTSENPFADLAGGLLGVVATKVTTGQALWFALLLELISGPGLWAIWSAVPKAREVGATEAKASAATTPAVTLPSPAVAPSPRSEMRPLSPALAKLVGEVFTDASKNPATQAELDPYGVRQGERLKEVLGEASKNLGGEDGGNHPTGPGTPAPMPEAPKIEEVAESSRNVLSFFRDDGKGPEVPRGKKKAHKPEGKVESWLGTATTQVDDPNVKVNSEACWKSYLSYCDDTGKHPLHRKVFSRQLGVLLGRKTGKTRKRDKNGSVFTGLMINPIVAQARRKVA